MATETKTDKPKKEKAKKEKVVKTPYVESEAAKADDQLNADGRLVKSPTGFDKKLHKTPGKVDFATESGYMRYKADQAEASANKYAEQATKLREDADNLDKYGDPAQRAKVKRFQRLQTQLAELAKTLEEEGLDVPGDEAEAEAEASA